ncbi:hypothetical protein AB0K18_35320 [Nonomuraea sp. NPDC049421]
MTSVPDPREFIRSSTSVEAPAVTSDNAAERDWYPRDRGPHRPDNT